MRQDWKTRKIKQKRLDAQNTGRLSQAKSRVKRKRGRRTTEDKFLIGARNGWLSFLEKAWHEIGWHLLQIRKRGTGTLDDVRRVFEPIGGKPENHWVDSFLRAVPQASEGKERRVNKENAVVLQSEIQKMRFEQQEFERIYAYAETAVQQAGELEKEIIQADADQKKRNLQELKDKLRMAENESNSLEQKVREQETHLYCSELLAFLCKGKYAVKPVPLANSLAGLPQMGWRQSLARCSKMPRSSTHVQYPYGILEAISKIWKRRSKQPQLSLIDLFRMEIPITSARAVFVFGNCCASRKDASLASAVCSHFSSMVRQKWKSAGVSRKINGTAASPPRPRALHCGTR